MVSRLKTLCRILVRHRFLLSAGLSSAAGIMLKSIILIPVTDPLFRYAALQLPSIYDAFVWSFAIFLFTTPFFLQRIGRAEEAVREIKRARELDPLSLHEADSVGWALLYSRRYDEAVDQFHKVLEMDPNYRRSMWGLARVYEAKGKYKEAIAECLKIPALPKIDPLAKALFRKRCSLYQKVYLTSGRKHINRKWFESSRQEIRDYVKASDDLYFITALYAASGEDDKALDLLEQLYARRDNDLVQLKVDPRMDNLRSNPRFEALLRRMNFPE